ncbi:Prostaglandin E synthase 3 [Bagarius yarrelli]|uniref:Prostaglandin E synthase 3 n=1 Tax=Bagarius yarrelli TaxID=175774 RepID=A0A556TIH2_BAGYA|nr:Prostaglandin E synthase 3 [Bagarius yarrelli]
MPKIVRPDNCQPAKALWFDRKKYLTINFLVQKPKNVQVDVTDTKIILSCQDDDDNNIYNEIEFYDRVHKSDSREKVYDRTINLLIRKMKDNVAWPRLTKDTAKPAWLSVDFENWRDWEHEEEDGRAEFEQYMDMLSDMNKKGEAPSMDDLDFDSGFVHVLLSDGENLALFVVLTSLTASSDVPHGSLLLIRPF